MLEFENQNIKFKQEYVPDIRKEVMVFANAEGDTVYVGVRQDGAVLVLAIGGAVIMTGAASLGTSFAILPELKKSKKQKKREFNASGSFKGLPEDDHRKIYRQKH
ncbi:hypothetical protein [Holdemanella biformis]|uniref:hypothetical protein n=1 Tax=Holdemanella biformis TaxID=1735 RepID=UPI0022E5CB1E|nr:hypothetical protein [Holdemanella biformis]